MAGGVDVLLRKIDEGVAEVRARYEADLVAKELSDELLYACDRSSRTVSRH